MFDGMTNEQINELKVVANWVDCYRRKEKLRLKVLSKGEKYFEEGCTEKSNFMFEKATELRYEQVGMVRTLMIFGLDVNYNALRGSSSSLPVFKP